MTEKDSSSGVLVHAVRSQYKEFTVVVSRDEAEEVATQPLANPLMSATVSPFARSSAYEESLLSDRQQSVRS